MGNNLCRFVVWEKLDDFLEMEFGSPCNQEKGYGPGKQYCRHHAEEIMEAKNRRAKVEVSK